jgi:predicted phage terminase large subunit-like protein
MPQITESPVQDPVEEFMHMTVLNNPYIPISPSTAQARFLLSQEDEVLYGGAAGGGKSVAMLAAALQFVMMPDYHALLLRRTFPDLTRPRALIPLSFEWLSDTDAEWSEREHAWYFPTGASLTFGHMNTERDKYAYQGAAYNFIGFDELTQFTQTMYTYLFSRLRRSSQSNIPGRMRCTSNPGGDGHDWVKGRFLLTAPNVAIVALDDETQESTTRIFIPAKLKDNPHLDQLDYKRKLGMLDPVTKAQLLRGDWDIMPEGNLFKRHWFKIIDSLPTDIVSTMRVWDLAATPPTAENPDPDYACGCKMSLTSRNTMIVRDVRRIRGGPAEVNKLLFDTAQSDGKGVGIRIEQEPGSAGKTLIYNYANQLLPGFDVRSVLPTGDKIVRASPFSAAASRGDVEIMRGLWNAWWLDSIVGFPGAKHDDTVDAPAHAYNCLTSDIIIEVPNKAPVGATY